MDNQYNSRAISNIVSANKNLMTHLKIRTRAGGDGTPSMHHAPNPRALCLEHVARLQNLKTEHFRGAHREQFVARFERERADALERVWRNYTKLSSYVDKEYLSEGAQERTSQITDGMAARTSFAQAILQHHIVRPNNDGNAANGTYHRGIKPSDCVSVDLGMVGAECDPGHRAETRKEYLRFCKVDPVVGGRRVATLGKATTLPVDNEPNPVKDRSGYKIRINQGEVICGYLNANGETVKFVKNKREKKMKEDREEAFLLDIDQALSEMDAESDRALLKQARSYLNMSDQEFKDRINSLAAHGDAIINE